MRFVLSLFLPVGEFVSLDDKLSLSRVCVRLCALLHTYLSNNESFIE